MNELTRVDFKCIFKGLNAQSYKCLNHAGVVEEELDCLQDWTGGIGGAEVSACQWIPFG